MMVTWVPAIPLEGETEEIVAALTVNGVLGLEDAPPTVTINCPPDTELDGIVAVIILLLQLNGVTVIPP